MKLFIIPSWYPTKIHPESGTFFKDRAQILKNGGIDVTLLTSIQHSLKDIIYYNKLKSFSFFHDNNLPTFLSEIINIYPKMEQRSFHRYQKHTIEFFNKAINRTGNPDIVFFNSSLWAASILSEHLKNKKIPYIISEHLKEFLLTNQFSPFQKLCIENSYNYASKIIATSSALKNSIANKFPITKQKISIIPNPIDDDIFSLQPTSKDGSYINIICVAMFRPEKELNILIEAFNKVIETGIKAKLKIIGDGPLMPAIKQQIIQLNRSNSIHLLGYLSQSDIVKQLHTSDFLVLPSKVETFGMVALEAQSCGIPVVATDCGGPHDIINRDSGLLVKSGSINALIKGLKTMIVNLDRYDSKNIREQTIAQFGKSRYTINIKNLLNEVL